MLLEGIPAAMIENAARMAGMPVGPLSLNDETALDLGLEDRAGRRSRSRAARRSIRRRRSCWRRWSRSTAGSAARTARASTTIRRAQPKRLWPGLADLLPKKLSREQIEALDVEELKQRFLVVQAVEAARTFEEGVVTDVREADVGSILGFGFAPFSGGTLSYIDMMGDEDVRRAVPAAGEEARRALCAARSSCSTWRRTATASTAASRRARRRRSRLGNTNRAPGLRGAAALILAPQAPPCRLALEGCSPGLPTFRNPLWPPICQAAVNVALSSDPWLRSRPFSAGTPNGPRPGRYDADRIARRTRRVVRGGLQAEGEIPRRHGARKVSPFA